MPRLSDDNGLRLKEYFDSVKQSCKETAESQREKDWVQRLGLPSFTIFILSLMTAIPRLLAGFFQSKHLLVWGRQISLSSVWLWWLLSTPLTLAIFVGLVKWGNAREKRKRKSWVPEPQMRFAYCYSVVDEISMFQTNGLQKHIDNAMESWQECQRLLYLMFRPYYMIHMPPAQIRRSEITIDPEGESRLFAVFLEVDELKRRFSWFRTEGTTDANMGQLAGLLFSATPLPLSLQQNSRRAPN